MTAWPKILALAIFAISMAGVLWFANNLAYNWLPREIAAMLGTFLFGCGVGFLVGQRHGIQR